MPLKLRPPASFSFPHRRCRLPAWRPEVRAHWRPLMSPQTWKPSLRLAPLACGLLFLPRSQCAGTRPSAAFYLLTLQRVFMQNLKWLLYHQDGGSDLSSPLQRGRQLTGGERGRAGVEAGRGEWRQEPSGVSDHPPEVEESPGAGRFLLLQPAIPTQARRRSASPLLQRWLLNLFFHLHIPGITACRRLVTREMKSASACLPDYKEVWFTHHLGRKSVCVRVCVFFSYLLSGRWSMKEGHSKRK